MEDRFCPELLNYPSRQYPRDSYEEYKPYEDLPFDDYESSHREERWGNFGARTQTSHEDNRRFYDDHDDYYSTEENFLDQDERDGSFLHYNESRRPDGFSGGRGQYERSMSSNNGRRGPRSYRRSVSPGGPPELYRRQADPPDWRSQSPVDDTRDHQFYGRSQSPGERGNQRSYMRSPNPDDKLRHPEEYRQPWSPGSENRDLGLNPRSESPIDKSDDDLFKILSNVINARRLKNDPPPPSWRDPPRDSSPVDSSVYRTELPMEGFHEAENFHPGTNQRQFPCQNRGGSNRRGRSFLGRPKGARRQRPEHPKVSGQRGFQGRGNADSVATTTSSTPTAPQKNLPVSQSVGNASAAPATQTELGQQMIKWAGFQSVAFEHSGKSKCNPNTDACSKLARSFQCLMTKQHLDSCRLATTARLGLKCPRIDNSFVNLLREKSVITSRKDLDKVLGHEEPLLQEIQRQLLESLGPLLGACNSYESSSNQQSPQELSNALESTVMACRQAMVLIGQTFAFLSQERRVNVLRKTGLISVAPEYEHVPNLEAGHLFGKKYENELRNKVEKVALLPVDICESSPSKAVVKEEKYSKTESEANPSKIQSPADVKPSKQAEEGTPATDTSNGKEAEEQLPLEEPGSQIREEDGSMPGDASPQGKAENDKPDPEAKSEADKDPPQVDIAAKPEAEESSFPPIDLTKETENMPPPEDEQIKIIAEKLAKFVAEKGEAAEKVVVQFKKDDPNYGFLFETDSSEHKYYKQKVAEFCKEKETPEPSQTDVSPESPEPTKQEEEPSMEEASPESVEKNTQDLLQNEDDTPARLQAQLLVKIEASPTCPTQTDEANEDVKTRITAEKLAKFVAECGPGLEEIAIENNRDNPTFRFLYDENSIYYKYYKEKVREFSIGSEMPESSLDPALETASASAVRSILQPKKRKGLTLKVGMLPPKKARPVGPPSPVRELKRIGYDKLAHNKQKKKLKNEDINYTRNKLATDNLGYQMLQKMGWKDGEGLGSDKQGIRDPVNRGVTSSDRSGLGVSGTPKQEAQDEDNEFATFRKRMTAAYRSKLSKS
uniref:SURP and G-patch domain-containing protein 2-like protein n=1 Tax=Callorhinchus milii TaxID=7868 RepID=V9K978_CALMI